MRTVERALSNNSYYILGERFTAADILLSTCITWAIRYGVPVSDPVVAYNNRIVTRDAYVRALQTNTIPAQASVEVS